MSLVSTEFLTCQNMVHPLKIVNNKEAMKKQTEDIESIKQWLSQNPPPKTSPYLTNKPPFKSRRNYHLSTTAVILLRPSHSATPWIIAATKPNSTTLQLHHPLTLKPHLTQNFDLTNFNPTILAVSYHTTPPFDKILVYPSPNLNPNHNHNTTLIALYNAGKLWGSPPPPYSPWVDLSPSPNHFFDDVLIFKGTIYALERDGKLNVVTSSLTSRRITMGQGVITSPVNPGLGLFRKRLVGDGDQLYLVVRMQEDLFRVYRRTWRGILDNWEEVKEFEGGKVLFMARDYYFFLPTEAGFVGREYKNCIVFSEAAFPKYGDGCWGCSLNKDCIAIFRMSDGTFVREYVYEDEYEDFPRINWSPPPWIYHDSSESSSESESEPEEDEGLDSNIRDEKDGEMQSYSIDQNKEQEVTESDSESEDDKDEQMQSDKMHSNENIEEDTKTSVRMNGGNDANVQGALRKNITLSVPRACTFCTTKGYKSDFTTAKFEGYDIRPDLVPTLQKIWMVHGNVIENSTMRSADIIARALESMATMVWILDDNSAQTFSDSQADYLTTTLSDLRCMCFKVQWLVPFVEKALKLHKSKPLLDSLNKLSQLSSKIMERRAILFEELAQLGEEENKLEEEMTKVSKMIPFSGQVRFDEPLGPGLSWTSW